MSNRTYETIVENMRKMEKAFSSIDPTVRRLLDASESLSNSLSPVLQLYNQIDFRQIDRIAENMRSITGVYANYESLSRFAEDSIRISKMVSPYVQQIENMRTQISIPDISAINRVLRRSASMSQNYSSIVQNLQNALSIWNYDYTNDCDDDFVDVPQELEEAITSVCEGDLSIEQIEKLGTPWQDRLKRIICKVLLYVILNLLLPAYAAFTLNPIFQTVKDVVLYRDQNEASSDGIIEENSRLEIWSDNLNQDYIEISYSYNGETIAGYVKRDDLVNNTIKVSDGISIDEVDFVFYCTSLMSEYWEIEPGEAYKRLNEDTGIITGFITKNYDALSKMDDDTIVTEIAKEYHKRTQYSRRQSERKKKINYTVVCIDEFAGRFNLPAKIAFHYLYDHKGIAFIKENYDIEHTLSIDEAIDDLTLVCRNNGGTY